VCAGMWIERKKYRDKKYNYIRAKCPYCSEKIYVREKDGVVYNYPRLLDDSKVPCCFRTPKK
jgi:DNA-directed RNA polymerase subunit RPC12/RpoP